MQVFDSFESLGQRQNESMGMRSEVSVFNSPITVFNTPEDAKPLQERLAALEKRAPVLMEAMLSFEKEHDELSDSIDALEEAGENNPALEAISRKITRRFYGLPGNENQIHATAMSIRPYQG